MMTKEVSTCIKIVNDHWARGHLRGRGYMSCTENL